MATSTKHAGTAARPGLTMATALVVTDVGRVFTNSNASIDSQYTLAIEPTMSEPVVVG